MMAAGSINIRLRWSHRLISTDFGSFIQLPKNIAMADQFNYDVFLSHSRRDRVRVREIAERLRADGLRVWFDEWVLKPGDSILTKAWSSRACWCCACRRKRSALIGRSWKATRSVSATR